jgi:PAS domain S-box-containing protein
MNATPKTVSPAGPADLENEWARSGSPHATDAQVGIWHWDFVAGNFYVDARWCDAVRVDPCAGPDHLERWALAMHPDDVAQFRRTCSGIRSGRLERFEFEYRTLAADSSWLWVLQRGRIIERAADASALRATGICIEIDDRKRAEVVLQENEVRLATALWGAQAAFWQWHAATDIATMSPQWFAMTGYTREQWESLPNPWVSRIHPDDRASVQLQIRHHLNGLSTSIEMEYRLMTASGQWKWLLTRGRSFEWDFDGRATSAIGVSLDIDARKRAERELPSSEMGLETAVWGAGMGLWETDFRRENTRWFSDWCGRLDLHPCEGEGHFKRWNANIHPEDVDTAVALFSNHVAGKADYYDSEYRIRDRQGRWRWLFERGRVVERDTDGTALRMVGVCMDVDERKDAELESGKSLQRLQAALESARGGMWDWNVSMDQARHTEFYFRMLGTDPKAGGADKNFWNNRVHPEDLPIVRAALRDVVQGRKEIYEAEYRLRHTDDTWRSVLDRGRVTDRNAAGRATRMVGFLVDVTDRVQTQETQSRILETMREGLVLIDATTDLVTLTNPAFDRMFGYEALELLGQSIEPLFSVSALQRKHLGRTLRDGSRAAQIMPAEFECARKDGSRFVATCVVTPLNISGSERWLAVLNDVTERKRLERGIIEIANREQQRIGSDLHDGLGQDLTGIALMLRGVVARLRKENSGACPDVEDVIGLVNNAIESTRALARGLSPVSGEHGGLAMALQTLAARASERYRVGVAFRPKLDEPLLLGETAATHVYRIVQEALTNVIRHSHATEVTITITTAGGELHLRVDDNGRGFDRSAPDRTGGLGLKIMRYRAQTLGGDLILESGVLGGASVRCSFPLDGSAAPVAPHPAPSPGPASL